MKVIIVGCGRLGSELSTRLFKRGHDVSVIDNVAASFQSLPPDFHGRLVEGDALQQDVLHRAGIRETEALAVVTSSDALNLVVGHVARTQYHVPTVIARNYGPNCRVLFETFGLQVVSSSSWGAQRVEEMISHSEMRTVFSAGNGEVEIYEVHIPKNWDGSTLSELIGSHAYPVAVTRAGRAFMPGTEGALMANDVVHVSSTFEGIEEIRKRLSSKKEEA